MKDLKKIALNLDYNKIMKRIVQRKDVKDYIVELITQEQLWKKGIGTSGIKLRPPYSALYKRRKAKLGLPTNRVTFYLRGGMYEKFIVIPMDNHFLTFNTARTKKGFDLADHLRRVYGHYEGLTEKNIRKLQDFILPILNNELNKIVA